MMIFLKPGEQVEVQFIQEGEVGQPDFKTYRQAYVVQFHEKGKVAHSCKVLPNGDKDILSSSILRPKDE